MNTKTVLYTTDFSELSLAALDWARRMADVFDAALHCLFVVDEPTNYWVGVGSVGPLGPTSEELLSKARMKMETFAANHLAGARQPPVTRVLSGKPFVEILRYAGEIGATMIVMSTHGRTGLSHALLGSTTEAVVRKAPCPVLVIRDPSVRFDMP
ncbi:MAG: universal stress protein [Planctomycetes bacterium]|nr:universal stress protein [Planctomycetota bacterium]